MSTLDVRGSSPSTGGGGAGSVATDTIFDAKGDLAAGTGADTASRLAVGADDTILMADAAAGTGLKWVASATPAAVGTAAVLGTADTFCRGDHVHAHEAAHVVHDTIWDAAGDLVVGSGADTSAKLTKGTAGDFLQAGASTLAYASVFINPVFSKQGVVTITTEGDTPPPFRWYNRSGRTLTFSAVSANATVGPSGSTMTVDVNVDGTTIMTGTKVVLPNNSGAASTVNQTTFSTTTIADGSYVSVNVDTNGGGAVQNLLVSVWLKG